MYHRILHVIFMHRLSFETFNCGCTASHHVAGPIDSSDQIVRSEMFVAPLAQVVCGWLLPDVRFV